MTLPVSGRLGIGYLGTTAIAVGAGVVTDGTLRVAIASDSAAPLPTGAATSAKQDTIIGHVDGIEAALTTIAGYVDGLEGLGTALNGFVDGLEGLQTTLNGYVDGLEGLLAGSQTVTNAGTFAVQVDGAALTSLQLIDDAIYVDDAAFTPGTSKVAAIALQADESGTDSVDEGDAGCPRMTLDRKTITAPQPHTAGGCSAAAFLSDGSTKAGVIKNAAGQLYGASFGNVNAAACYVRLYNMTTNPATSDTPVYRFVIPGATTGGGREKTFPLGLAFSTGIAYRITTGAADNNDTATASAEVTANFDYK